MAWVPKAWHLLILRASVNSRRKPFCPYKRPFVFAKSRNYSKLELKFPPRTRKVAIDSGAWNEEVKWTFPFAASNERYSGLYSTGDRSES